MSCSSVCAGAPLWIEANWESGSDVVTASMLVSTTSTTMLFPPSISRNRAGVAASPAIKAPKGTWDYHESTSTDLASGGGHVIGIDQ